MKKFIALVIFLALAVIFIPWLHPAGAADQPTTVVNVYQDQQLVKSVVFAIGMDQYFVNGQTPGVKMDAKPFLQNGRTFVPVRYLGYALGLKPSDITWDDAAQKATLRGKATLEMTVGKAQIATNGQATDIDVAPILNEDEGRTYLPARYVAEGLGYQVDWDNTTQTVICWPAGQPKPDVSAVQKYIANTMQGQQPPVQQTQSDTGPKGKLMVGHDGGGGTDTTPATPYQYIPWNQNKSN